MRRQDSPYPPSWKDPSGLTHPVIRTAGGEEWVVSVAACHPSRFIQAHEVVFNQPTTCLTCVLFSRL